MTKSCGLRLQLTNACVRILTGVGPKLATRSTYRTMPSCFGICFTQESSRQPRKGYNSLVPAVFPKDAPSWDEPIDLACVRKIGQLEDYVQANVQKAPKVSRRLSRRVLKEAGSPSGLSQCKVGSWFWSAAHHVSFWRTAPGWHLARALLACCTSPRRCTAVANHALHTHPTVSSALFTESKLSAHCALRRTEASASAVVQIGVHALMQLLHAGGDRNSSLFAKEVVRDANAVVPQLLARKAGSAEEAARATLGLELLAHFLAVQSASDYARPLAQHIKAACALACHAAAPCTGSAVQAAQKLNARLGQLFALKSHACRSSVCAGSIQAVLQPTVLWVACP